MCDDLIERTIELKTDFNSLEKIENKKVNELEKIFDLNFIGAISLLSRKYSRC